jgi:thiamine kinase-like enzyme
MISTVFKLLSTVTLIWILWGIFYEQESQQQEGQQSETRQSDLRE